MKDHDIHHVTMPMPAYHLHLHLHLNPSYTYKVIRLYLSKPLSRKEIRSLVFIERIGKNQIRYVADIANS